MLSPESRTVAVELLRPPPEYRLDIALLTTYTLDLEALLALPLAVFAQTDSGVEEILDDPLLLLEGLREAGERIHLFVDQTGIAIPRKDRELYAMLEASVHPVRAPSGGVFHPKVWVARFTCEDGPPRVRVAILSRNLTFDRSWDVALTSEATPNAKRRPRASRPLSELIEALPELTEEGFPRSAREEIAVLADEVARSSFSGPDGFGEIHFHSMGLNKPQRVWRPPIDGSRLLAIAPFIGSGALANIAEVTEGERILVSRQEALDDLPEERLAAWGDQIFVLSDAAAEEPEDGMESRPSGLHAKLMAVEHGHDVTWYIGSANLTSAALWGRNVEALATITGRKGRKGGNTGNGIDRFLESGFENLLAPYCKGDSNQEDTEAKELAKTIEEARDRLVNSSLKVVCRQSDDSWIWQVDGKVSLPENVEVRHWPITVAEELSRPFNPPLSWSLPEAKLTAFVAFKLGAGVSTVDDIRMTLKLPAEGMPEGRIAHALRSLIDSPERLLRFLRALLGGLEGMIGWAQGNESRGAGNGWGEWLSGETLLEDLLRTVSRDPDKLASVRRLIEELRETEEGRKIVPDDLFAVWTAVEETLQTRARTRS